MGTTGQDWHFLSQPCTREAQPESAVSGREKNVPAVLCLLQEPAQPRAVVGNWEMLLTCEAVLLCQLAQRSGWLLQRRG